MKTSVVPTELQKRIGGRIGGVQCRRNSKKAKEKHLIFKRPYSGFKAFVRSLETVGLNKLDKPAFMSSVHIGESQRRACAPDGPIGETLDSTTTIPSGPKNLEYAICGPMERRTQYT